MELEKLRIFLAVAETGSISAAARKLFVSHSTVSRTVSALEKELECELVVHGKNRTEELTKAGALLEDGAKNILRQTDALKEQIRLMGTKDEKHDE